MDFTAPVGVSDAVQTCCTWRPAGYRRGPGWLGVGEIPLPEPFGVLLIALSGSSAPRCLMLSLHSAHSEMGVCGLE